MRYLFILLVGSQLFGQRYETQSYTALGILNSVEIRYYPASIQVKTTSQIGNNNNFSKLFKYISKGNQSQAKIAMTTPVYTQTKDGQRQMSFVLPKKYMENPPPTPTAKDVLVKKVDGGYFAALRFGGYNSVKKTNYHENKLKNTLYQAGINIQSELFVLGYNSPFALINRRNEVMYAIDSLSLTDSLLQKMVSQKEFHAKNDLELK